MSTPEEHPRLLEVAPHDLDQPSWRLSLRMWGVLGVVLAIAAALYAGTAADFRHSRAAAAGRGTVGLFTTTGQQCSAHGTCSPTGTFVAPDGTTAGTRHPVRWGDGELKVGQTATVVYAGGDEVYTPGASWLSDYTYSGGWFLPTVLAGIVALLAPLVLVVDVRARRAKRRARGPAVGVPA